MMIDKKMRVSGKFILTIAVVAMLCGYSAAAQFAPTILEIETVNRVAYTRDASDLARLATDPAVTRAAASRNFASLIVLADIVAINGQRAKGTYVAELTFINLRTNAAPGQASADTVRDVVGEHRFEILHEDGTPIGTLMASGLGEGPAPPGAPPSSRGSNFAIIGGTGAYLGAHGQMGLSEVTVPGRVASVTEDPANRRIHGGGARRFVAQLIPEVRPEIIVVNGRGRVFHSAISDQGPARPGETLALHASGLGDWPVQVKVNGKVAEMMSPVSYDSHSKAYRVEFRLPDDTPPGTAVLQLNAGWVEGSEIKIAVQ